VNRHRGAEVLRIAVVDLPDLSTLLSGADGLLTELALPGGRSLDLLRLPAMGWRQTAETLEGLPERADVVLTSATGEIDHARHDSREDLLRLVGAVAELRSRLIVANVSTIACSEPGRPADKATRLEARRLNLLIMEVSASTGLAVLDVDRIAAETITSPKTTGRFTYGEAVSRSLRAGLLGVLGGLGLTARSTFALRTPFVRQASDLRV
jgi:hypothetical protein